MNESVDSIKIVLFEFPSLNFIAKIIMNNMEQNHIFVMNMNNIEKALKDSIVKKSQTLIQTYARTIIKYHLT